MLKRVMNQRELLSHLARTTSVSEASAGALLEELARVAREETKSNGAFVLPGIGFITRRESSERIGKNPSTGEAIKIPAMTNLGFEFASRFKQTVLATRTKREGMLTTSIWKVPSQVLEAIEREAGSAKEWNTLDPKGFPIDQDFTALLDEHGDLFAYVLTIEGLFDAVETGGLMAGYVSPKTLQDRAAELEGVDLGALEKGGYLEPRASQRYGASFTRLKEFIRSAATENLGLIIVTYF
jgi:DNA-binding protein HU-beta